MRSTRILALAALAAAHTPAPAYTTNGWWDKNSVAMHASNVSFPSDSHFRDAMSDTYAWFNRNPSQFRLSIGFGDSSVSRWNWQSEVWATNDWEWGDAVAVELSRYGLGGKIKASDIIFDARIDNWTSSQTATNLSCYMGDWLSFQAILIHELGHSAGLGHENGEYNVMGETTWHVHRKEDRARPYVGEDAANGLIAIYGRRSGESIEDLSAAHFKWVGTSGEYSDHHRTRLYATNGSEIGYDSYSGMRRYSVNKGQQVDVEFTYENSGETNKTGVAIGFYISENDLITTADRLIATKSCNLARADVATRTDRVTIPSDLASGQTYYLGVIVDRTSAFAEVDEDNNRAFHIIRIN